MAAHPQHEDEPATDVAEQSAGLLAKNPFPSQMTVPGLDGTPVVVELAVIGGVVYAPNLAEYPISPRMKQYVTNFCSAWTSTSLTTGQIEQSEQQRPRRAEVIFDETQLHAMLGLANDERLLRVVVDQLTGRIRFIVESPRLPQQPYWNGEPPPITLPIAAWYEGGPQA